MPVHTTALLGHLSPTLVRLVADLSARAADPAVDAVLREEHAAEARARRTADPFEVWVDGRVVQIGAAWLLSLLFVRTLEDRGLLPPRLQDPSADHRGLLRGLAPFLTDTDYLLLLFRELSRHRAVRDVFDPNHNPVWTLAPSPDMAAELLALCRDPARLGGVDLSQDTRFLGDVYERLDEGVRDRYALLQTPDFVEAFILDRTLSPALAERGVNRLTVIDPTCGSGHFLLGAFHRLFQAWADADPAAGAEAWASRALSQVYGVDLNPYAVAIARFRLVLAYLEAAGLRTLDASRDLRLNLAVADSLRPVDGARQQPLGGGLLDPEQRAQWQLNPYAASQGADAARVLGGRSFDVVVGNPPYITVKDDVLREVYRELYTTVAGKYQLVVPFTERFFGLANEAGWVGAIVGNGFMKREFGKKLIEEFLPTVDLAEVVDTSGAFIPGHGTPTVILLGRRQKPQGDRVLAVMGKRGEPSTPEHPEDGLVWTAIREHDQDVGYDDDFISIDLLERAQLATHPWSLRGGGAGALKAMLDSRADGTLGKVAEDIGFASFPGQDDAFVFSAGRSALVGDVHARPFVTGESIRDWSISCSEEAIATYDDAHRALSFEQLTTAERRHFWALRELVGSTISFGGKTRKQNGDPYWTWYRWQTERYRSPFRITFAFVATHNHFVLDRGGKVFTRTAPIIKLPPEATEDDHLALLGYLNSSTACFWMKQVFFCKGAQGVNEGLKSAAWMQFYEFDSTKIKQFPIPERHRDRVIELARALDRLATERADDSPLLALNGAWSDADGLKRNLAERRARQDLRLSQMVAQQEALDWTVYAAYGIADDALWSGEVAERSPNDRVVDRLTNRAAQRGMDDAAAWFAVHGWDPGAVAAQHERTPPSALDQRRLDALGSSRALRLIEAPDYKRRWYRPDYDAEEREALQSWLLTRLEAELRASPEPTPRSTRSLAQALHRDPKVRAVAELLSGTADPDLEALLSALTADEAVPYLAAWRYKEPGLKKFRLWQRTWDAQRAEDAWEAADPALRGPRPTVPLPPAYDSGDFAKPAFWSSRGKLDVPKERFIAYPGLSDDDDPTPLLGWAGWDHADRMAALGHLLERHSADPERLPPLLAGMVELQPWVDQWRGDDRRYGTPLGPLWAGHIDGALAAARLTREALSAWRPAAPTRGRKKR